LKAFLERINDLPDGARIMKYVEKKEKIEKQRDFSNKLIKQKVDYSNEEEDYACIKIVYPPNSKQSEFSYEEDQFLIFLTFNHGYGNWEEIVRAIRLSDDFMFNYYLKSRDKSEIQKRVDYLVKVLEREVIYLIMISSEKCL
jgi:hypothetical protein